MVWYCNFGKQTPWRNLSWMIVDVGSFCLIIWACSSQPAASKRVEYLKFRHDIIDELASRT
jgi:hypothetical protein